MNEYTATSEYAIYMQYICNIIVTFRSELWSDESYQEVQLIGYSNKNK